MWPLCPTNCKLNLSKSCFSHFLPQKFWQSNFLQYFCTLFSGNENLTPEKWPRFLRVKVVTETQKITKIDWKTDKNAAKIKKMHFFSKKMQKNFGSSKISSTFAAGFAQKSKIRVETSSLKDWNNRCSTSDTLYILYRMSRIGKLKSLVKYTI